jgi:amidase
VKAFAITAALAALTAALASGPALAGPVLQRTQAAIDRIHRLDPMLHAVLAVDPTALDQARRIEGAIEAGPAALLGGMPVLVKDNVETAGPLPTTAGSLALIANVSHRDAPLVARLRAAGAVILGKTNLSEWANFRSTSSVSGWSAVGGQTRNPWALDRNTCGSSSGSGAAVAAGIVDAAIGTETNGSITCPASLNGIVGLKPTVGLVSRARIVPISASQDTAGPMAKDVRTAALLLTAIAGSDPADPATAPADSHRADYHAALDAQALHGARLGVIAPTGGWTSATRALFDRTLATLRARGAVLVEVKPPEMPGLGAAESLVLNTEFKAGLAAYLAETPPAVPIRTLANAIAFDEAHAAREMGLFGQEQFIEAEATKGLDDPAYREALALLHHETREAGIDALLAKDHLDALVSPTVSPAWRIDSVNGDNTPADGFGGIAAIAGYPHLTVPMGLVGGLPVGLSFIGPAWSDARLLALGYAFEHARGALPKPSLLATVPSDDPASPLLQPYRR